MYYMAFKTISHKTPNFKSTRAAYHTGFWEKYHSAADIVRGAVAMEFQAKQFSSYLHKHLYAINIDLP